MAYEITEDVWSGPQRYFKQHPHLHSDVTLIPCGICRSQYIGQDFG